MRKKKYTVDVIKIRYSTEFSPSKAPNAPKSNASPPPPFPIKATIKYGKKAKTAPNKHTRRGRVLAMIPSMEKQAIKIVTEMSNFPLFMSQNACKPNKQVTTIHIKSEGKYIIIKNSPLNKKLLLLGAKRASLLVTPLFFYPL